MKTRIVLGLLASVVALTATSAEADAATKKRGAKATTKHASVEATPRPAAPLPAATTKAPAKKAATTKVASVKKAAAATKPASLTTTASPGKRASATKATSTTRPASLESLPILPEKAAPVSEPSAATKASATKLSRFLASGVPLTEVREGRLGAIGSTKLPCGTKSRWAKAQSRWHALDAWGRITGTLTVGGSDRDGGSGCNQVHFREGTGKDGLGVFVAVGSGYTVGPSAEWKADADAVKRFEQLYATQESVWVDGKIDRGAAHERKRTLFFELPKQQGSVEGAPTQRRPTRWAVSGGRVLVVGYVGASGAWKVGHVLSPTGKDHAYEPLAILDMNGDGLPEIVVHEEAGGVFVDRVLSFDAGTMRWENAVASPGGATR